MAAYTAGLEPAHTSQPEGALTILALCNLVTPELPTAFPLFKM